MATEEAKVKAPGAPDVPKPDTSGGDNDKPPVGNDDKSDVVQIDDNEYILDENGNALTESGEVFKTKEELDKLKDSGDGNEENENDTVTEIQVDDETYKIDDNGNAVDNDGNIKYTKEQLEEFEEERADDVDLGDAFEKIKKTVNLDIIDNNGNPIEFENTPEGITSYISEVRRRSIQEGQQAGVESLINQHPVLERVLNHLELNNGKLDGFNPTFKYKDVNYAEDNTDAQKEWVIENEIRLGKSREDAEELANLYEDSNKLKDKSKAALEQLKKSEDDQLANEKQRLQEQRKQQEEEAKEYWGVEVTEDGKLIDLNKGDSVYNKVKQGKLSIDGKEYIIPENIRVKKDDGSYTTVPRDEFFNYLYVPYEIDTPNGPVVMTRHQYDIAIKDSQRSIDADIFDAFKLFTGNDTSQFIEENIRKQEIRKIRKLKTKQSNNREGAGGSENVKIVPPHQR